ncbi:copper chaperone PCu(A)C [Brevundimonas bacteroides]|uniref:copper chaperone PCu(A)C n=1 Tax=Brevundimonas bacteroides TaxID=74311 RepID=UPI0004959972|nr:copper chaperone PCu(A)C [Brevundimonas bacteroides]
MHRLALLALVAAALAACSPSSEKAPSGEAAASAVTVTDVLCRPTPNGRQVTGCYMTLTAPTDDTLVSIESPIAALAQVHETRMESNMMMMRELEAGLPLPAGEAVQLKPGGNHLMLHGVREPLRAGQTVPLTLTFASAAPVEVTARVGQPPAAGEDHSGH